jgi:urease subunit alpha
VVDGCRAVRKPDMVRNAATPSVRVDAQRRRVVIDGVDVELSATPSVPLNRAYFLA